MDESAKYLIHATIAADGVVERSDVVGAVFGQTEGLLGSELDLRDLQQSSKVGRIDVEIDSENGQSFGEVTLATDLDKVETAILAAALETITRVGPCRASIEVTDIEDVRAAKRRAVVERAKELLAESFTETALSSREVLDEVREAIRPGAVTEYRGLPAGPRVGESDAVVLVEGRADVIRLLRYGMKNAIAVEGTDVPDAVAELTADRTTTAFLDGDRGGELVLRELAQIGDVDCVAFAPAGRSVEDLTREEVHAALRRKVPYDRIADRESLRTAARDAAGSVAASTDDATASGPDRRLPTPSDDDDSGDPGSDDGRRRSHDEGDESGGDGRSAAGGGAAVDDREDGGAAGPGGAEREPTGRPGTDAEPAADPASNSGSDSDVDSGSDSDPGTPAEPDPSAGDAEPGSGDGGPRSLRDHVGAVIGDATGEARLLDDDGGLIETVDADDAFDAVASADPVPHAVVVDGTVTQRLLDVAAQRGVAELFGRSTGEFVKQPVATRVRTAADLRIEA